MLIVFLLLVTTGQQVADIYDILKGDNGVKPRSSNGEQYVIGIYKDKPDHAIAEGTRIVSMKNSFGTEFTCQVPNIGSGSKKKDLNEKIDSEDTESLRTQGEGARIVHPAPSGEAVSEVSPMKDSKEADLA